MAAGLSEHQGRSTGHTVPDWLERLPGGPQIPVLVSVFFGGGWPGTGRA
jgi:hypothetical protein